MVARPTPIKLLEIAIMLGLALGSPKPVARADNAGSVDQKKEETRALWVTRWDYKTPEHVRAIVSNAAQYGFNTLYFQVRGEATTYYPSDIEPWAWELSSKDDVSLTGTDPGWDPLALAISEARKHGLDIHAYMNVLPGWKQEKAPPASSGQLFATHPEWFMVDAEGRTMDPKRLEFYAFLNPILPEVRAHLRLVFAEVARRMLRGKD